VLTIQGCTDCLGEAESQLQIADTRASGSDPLPQSQILAGIDIPKWSFPPEEVPIIACWWHEFEVSYKSKYTEPWLTEQRAGDTEADCIDGFPRP